MTDVPLLSPHAGDSPQAAGLQKPAMVGQSGYINLEDTYGAHNYRPLDVVLSRGSGV